jgi:hypothetical protein
MHISFGKRVSILQFSFHLPVSFSTYFHFRDKTKMHWYRTGMWENLHKKYTYLKGFTILKHEKYFSG